MEVLTDRIEEYLNITGKRFIDEDTKCKIREILRCAVCLEIPKKTHYLKVPSCIQGHHFCSPCFKKLKHCAICRAQCYEGRNFVVEELITQVGEPLGLTKVVLPHPSQPPAPSPGIFTCPHQCGVHTSAVGLLKHIRMKHSHFLIDNLRSNPYIKRVSDMGLFTAMINIGTDQLIGTIHMLSSDASVLSSFQYRLTVIIPKSGCSHEFSVSNCDLLMYDYDVMQVSESGKCLKVEVHKLCELIEFGEAIQLFCSIWRKNDVTESKADHEVFSMEVDKPTLLLPSDRNKRRNHQRNLRRKRLKQLDKSDSLINILEQIFSP